MGGWVNRGYCSSMGEREATLEKDAKDAKVTRQRKLPEQMMSHLEDDISLSALCRVLKGQECERQRKRKKM